MNVQFALTAPPSVFDVDFELATGTENTKHDNPNFQLIETAVKNFFLMITIDF